MKTRGRFALLVGALCMLMISCMLPGMIALNKASEGPLPHMETNSDEVMKTLNGEDWVPLGALTAEQYSEEDYSKPGTLTYTVDITDDRPTYFSYGWCAVDEEILRQNFQHIAVTLYINDSEIASDSIHNLSFASNNPRASAPLQCVDFGVLLSEWPDGTYTLKAVAAFDEQINDGLDDYEPGDYIFIYNVTVQKKEGATPAPSG